METSQKPASFQPYVELGFEALTMLGESDGESGQAPTYATTVLTFHPTRDRRNK
jgi:hypothetical protein